MTKKITKIKALKDSIANFRPGTNTAPSATAREIARLKKENMRLREELEILKEFEQHLKEQESQNEST